MSLRVATSIFRRSFTTSVARYSTKKKVFAEDSTTSQPKVQTAEQQEEDRYAQKQDMELLKQYLSKHTVDVNTTVKKEMKTVTEKQEDLGEKIKKLEETVAKLTKQLEKNRD